MSSKYNILEGFTIQEKKENKRMAVICLGQSLADMQQSRKMTNPEDSLKRTDGQTVPYTSKKCITHRNQKTKKEHKKRKKKSYI